MVDKSKFDVEKAVKCTIFYILEQLWLLVSVGKYCGPIMVLVNFVINTKLIYWFYP